MFVAIDDAVCLVRSLAQLAKAYKVSRTSVAKALKQPEGVTPKIPFPFASADT
jgi:hypothetical protein